MRIAYRGNFRHPFCTEVHVAASLEALGHTVVRLQENETTWARCVEAGRRAHLFLWTKTWIVDPDGGHRALDELRAAGIPSVSFHLDRYIGLDREAQIPEDPFWKTDFVFTADGGSQEKFESYGVNHRWLPPGVFGPECRIGRPSRKFPHPVVFVGSYPYPHAEWAPYREELIARFRERFGTGFAVWPRGRPIRNKELSDLYASAKVVVGDSCLVGNPSRYWSDRIPETVGRGGALIHPEVEGLDDWYRHREHLVTYPVGDFDAALEQAEWLLANDEHRELIRRHGQETVLQRDTYEHRLRSVLQMVGVEHGWPELGEPNEVVVARRGRAHAGIQVRPGHPTDREVVDEVWRVDQYGLGVGADVRGKVVVDVGANIGAFSVLVAALGARQVHAWEPEPSNFAMLEANTAAFPNIARRQEALGSADAELILAPGPGGVHGGGTHAVLPSESEAPAVAKDPQNVVVALRHAGEALAEIGPIGLLKLDCEGSEYAICSVLDLTQIERIVGEWHGPVMPHLADRWPASGVGDFMTHWSLFVARLADHGHLELHGHPRAGGLFRWQRF